MLIAPIEVVWNSPAGRDYPLDQICLLGESAEEAFVESCLGCEMWEWLLENAEPWPDNVGEWCEGEEYADGDHVTFEGTLYRSLENANTESPAAGGGAWERPQRFGDIGCANELWEKYLKKAVAIAVFERTLPFSTARAGANGLTLLDNGSQFSGQIFRNGNQAEINSYLKGLESARAGIVAQMMRWANKKAKEGGCQMPLSTVPGCGDTGAGCKAPGHGRRFGFKY